MKFRTINFFVLTTLLVVITFSSCSKEDSLEKIEPNLSELVKISVTSLPDKTTYSLGEPLSLKGLIVEGINSDNSKQRLDITEANISGFSSEKSSDDLTLSVTINKLTTTFSVKVLPIKVENGVLTKVEANLTRLVLPDFVTSIASNVFRQSNITHVTLNEGLKSIGEQAFAWSQITEINFPKTLVTIDEAAFYGCDYLKEIDLSQTSLTQITHETFALNKNVTVIKLPQSVKEIEYQAFLNATSLKELYLPDGLLKMGNEAFRESGLVNLRLPNSLCYMDQRVFYLSGELERVETFGRAVVNTSIADQKLEASTFERCPKLIHFEIPQNVEIIGQNTISGSPNLESIVIPATVKQINFNAFANTGLKVVTVEGTAPAIANTISGAWQAFPYTVQTIKVPAGSVETYKAAHGWNSFAKQIVE